MKTATARKTKAPDSTGCKQDDPRSKGWFKPGQSGNPSGRPIGSRNKLDELFVEALFKDFKEGGVNAIRACRTEKPDVYLNVIAKVLPKQVDVKADSSITDLADGLHAVAEFLSGFAEGAGSANHEGAVPGGSVLPAGLRTQTH
jgi:hypothetical protein